MFLPLFCLFQRPFPRRLGRGLIFFFSSPALIYDFLNDYSSLAHPCAAVPITGCLYFRREALLVESRFLSLSRSFPPSGSVLASREAEGL